LATVGSVCITAKFQDALTKHQESAQKHLNLAKDDDYYSSSDDDDNADDGDAGDKDIFKSLVKSFNLPSGDVASDLGTTHEYIVNSLQTKANVCLICIESVKKAEPIWNCSGCYTTFHIMCIQRWVKDGVYQHSALSKEHFPDEMCHGSVQNVGTSTVRRIVRSSTDATVERSLIQHLIHGLCRTPVAKSVAVH